MNIKKFIYTSSATSLLALVLAMAVSMGTVAKEPRDNGSVDVAHNTEPFQTGDFKTFDEYLNSMNGVTPLPKKAKVLTPTDLLARRMADGLFKYFSRKDGWANCGVIHRERGEILARAKVYAYIIILASEEQSGEDFSLNPWGMMGTMLQESGLDSCATGKNPREAAYRLGLLKRPRFGLTHPKDDLIKALEHPKMKRLFSQSGYDLGLGQMLQMFYDRPNDIERIFNPVYAANQTAKEMVRRARRSKTDRPWLYWRGHKSPKYENKVVWQARRAGASREDI